ncbi:MAG: 30S ribosomal protein S18 [Anaerolineae bacterium]
MDNQQPVTPQPASREGQAPRPPRPPYAERGPRPDRGPQGEGREGGRGGNRRFGPPIRRVCAFCKDPNKQIDYKNGDMLRRYLTERGKIRPRRKIGTCARHQRQLSLAIKQARHLALLPYAPEHIRGDK